MNKPTMKSRLDEIKNILQKIIEEQGIVITALHVDHHVSQTAHDDTPSVTVDQISIDARNT